MLTDQTIQDAARLGVSKVRIETACRRFRERLREQTSEHAHRERFRETAAGLDWSRVARLAADPTFAPVRAGDRRFDYLFHTEPEPERFQEAAAVSGFDHQFDTLFGATQ